MMIRDALRKVFIVAACAPLTACSQTVRKPQLLHPGPAPFQRANAEVFDPYPQPDVGPEVVGGRPREYAAPRNEVERAQEFLRSAGARPVQEVIRTQPPIGAPIAVGAPFPVGQPLPAAPPFSTTPSGPRY